MMHVYPIRNSRNYWKIPLYCCHECTISCQNKFTVTSEGNIDIIQNPHYDSITKKCNKYDSLCPATIPIHSFSLNDPHGLEGKLFYPDLIVIPDESFNVYLTFPFNTTVEVGVKTHTPITLRELLELIKQLYIQIYEDEEKTSESTLFTITRSCECVNSDLKSKVASMLVNTADLNTLPEDGCSVCYMPLEQQIVKLSCNHLFHKECIFSWIDKGTGFTCPLCRTAIHNCNECNNNQIITTEEEYVVLPVHLRDLSMDRNTTNGIYGIYTHDLENLYITELKYNRIMKLLQVSVKV